MVRFILICAALLAFVLLAGCATKTPASPPEPVPFAVACPRAEDLPARPAALPERGTSDARPLLDLALERLAAWAAYGDAVEAGVAGCKAAE